MRPGTLDRSGRARTESGCAMPIQATPVRSHRLISRPKRRSLPQACRAPKATIAVRAAARSRNMDIGFIGIGRMGAGIAANLLKAGHQVTVYNRTRTKAEALAAKGAKVAADIAGACRGDVVFTMLANDE